MLCPLFQAFCFAGTDNKIESKTGESENRSRRQDEKQSQRRVRSTVDPLLPHKRVMVNPMDIKLTEGALLGGSRLLRYQIIYYNHTSRS